MKTAASKAHDNARIGGILAGLATVALLLVSPDLLALPALAASDEKPQMQKEETSEAIQDEQASEIGPGKEDSKDLEDSRALEEEWGIKIESVRMTAANQMVDFRYRVIDIEKAGVVFDRRNKAFLMDEASGAMLPVPRTAKVGPLRQTNFKADTKRIYFVLFSNHGGHVKSGSLVSFIIGDKRIENIKIQ